MTNKILVVVTTGLLSLVLGCGSKPSNSAAGSAAGGPVDAAAIRAKAEAGDAKAQAHLGQLYVKGEGVTNSYKEAARWYRLAASQGHIRAQYNLGCVYGTGRTVPFDQPEAAKWLLMAANAGDALAQLNVGERYERGVGIKADRVEALKWYLLATAQGQTDSSRRADGLKRNMAASEIDEARRRASSFSPKVSSAPSPQ